MQKYIDCLGRVWVVTIDVATIKRVRSLTGVNLLEIVEGELIERLSNDPVLLCDVLYAVLEPQAKTQNVSEEAFGQGLAGNAIADATTALLQGLIDFFPEPKSRLLGKAASKYQQVQSRAMEWIEERLENPALEKELLSQLEKASPPGMSNDSFTDWPVS